MKPNYPSIQGRVTKLITDFGMRATLDGARTQVVFDDANKDDAPTSPSVVTGVTSAEKVALLPGKGPVPAVGSVLVCKLGEFTVLNVEVTQPAETPLLYTCRVRA